MSEEIEWVKIPVLETHEVNKDGEVRKTDSKEPQAWGRNYFLYGPKGHTLRMSMFEIMRAPFGNDSVDKSNALRVE